VQSWVDGSAENHGVMLIADGSAGKVLKFDDVLALEHNIPNLDIEWYQPRKSVYYLKDHLGSVRATVDENGQLVSRDDYDPWGLQLAGRSWAVATGLPNKFTGKERDDDFGLNWDYFGARYYDPEIARWLAVDPLEEKYPTLNPYNYTANNPLAFIDLDGAEIYDTKTGAEVKPAEAKKRTYKAIGKAFAGSKDAKFDFFYQDEITDVGIGGLIKNMLQGPKDGGSNVNLGEPLRVKRPGAKRTSEVNTLRVNTEFQGEQLRTPIGPPSFIGTLSGAGNGPESLIFQLQVRTSNNG